jgi:hypothetical protein
MAASAENLQKLAEKIGIQEAQESLALMFLDYPGQIEKAQYYMLGVLNQHIQDDFPTQEEVCEYYDLLGLPPEETKKFTARYER